MYASSVLRLLFLCTIGVTFAWVNDYDEPFLFECPVGRPIYWFQSDHDDYYNDRIFDFEVNFVFKSLIHVAPQLEILLNTTWIEGFRTSDKQSFLIANKFKAELAIIASNELSHISSQLEFSVDGDLFRVNFSVETTLENLHVCGQIG